MPTSSVWYALSAVALAGWLTSCGQTQIKGSNEKAAAEPPKEPAEEQKGPEGKNDEKLPPLASDPGLPSPEELETIGSEVLSWIKDQGPTGEELPSIDPDLPIAEQIAKLVPPPAQKPSQQQPQQQPPRPTMTSLSVQPASVSLPANGTVKFRATAGMSDGSTRDVTSGCAWGMASQNPIAGIDANGSLRVGATVTKASDVVVCNYRLEAQSWASSAVVNYQQPAPPPRRTLVSVSLSPNAVGLRPGDGVQLRAGAMFSDETTADVTNVCTWRIVGPTWIVLQNGHVGAPATAAAGVMPTKVQCTYEFEGVVKEAFADIALIAPDPAPAPAAQPVAASQPAPPPSCTCEAVGLMPFFGVCADPSSYNRALQIAQAFQVNINLNRAVGNHAVANQLAAQLDAFVKAALQPTPLSILRYTIGIVNNQCVKNYVAGRFDGCFALDTKIRLADGSERPITGIMVGDLVWEPRLGRGLKVKRVTHGVETKDLLAITVGGRRVVVTELHPFPTRRGMVTTLALRVGDRIVGERGRAERVTKIERVAAVPGQAVMNLELDRAGLPADVDLHVLADGVVTGDLAAQEKLGKGR